MLLLLMLASLLGVKEEEEEEEYLGDFPVICAVEFGREKSAFCLTINVNK